MKLRSAVLLILVAFGTLATCANGQLFTGDLQPDRPECASSRRGRFWTQNGGYVGDADSVYVCLRDVDGFYEWFPVSASESPDFDSITIDGFDVLAIVTTSARFDYGAISIGECETISHALTGAINGATCTVSVADAGQLPGGVASVWAFGSAADTVKVRACATGAAGVADFDETLNVRCDHE